MSHRIANMVAFWPPADAGMQRFLASHPVRLNFHLQAAAHVKRETAAAIESQRRAAARLCTAQPARRHLWTLMIEWDQSGGAWVPGGRPRYTGLSRAQAHARFTDYYLNQSPPLGAYLRQTERPCRLAAITDHSPNVFDAYEWGVDVGLLERGVDELGDIATGLAFMRGAGRQYDRPWGIDLSTWRTAADSATRFDADGRLTGGWSPSYLLRHMYAAYMAGAHILQIEPTLYYTLDGAALNPFGRAVQRFASFALRRHRDVGAPVVPVALMLDAHSGFDTKHGPYNQADAVWYQDIPYGPGDFMIDNFLKVAYPGHERHGTTTGAPFSTPAGYQRFLAAGGDPRPYEPMPFTRWGDTFDVLRTTAPASALGRYRVLVLLGDVTVDGRLRAGLEPWVRAGNTLVVNVRQVSAEDEPLLGVRLGSAERSGSTSRWIADGTTYPERPFRYRVVTPGTARVLATAGDGAPLVTSNPVGSGQVILTTPDHLQTAARDGLLEIGVRLLDELQRAHAPAVVSGPGAQYFFAAAPGRLITTIINHSADTWHGTITAPITGPVFAVREYVGDTAVACTRAGGRVTVPAHVPPYDVRVFAVEYAPDATGPSAGC
ncbi:MAG TPA: hypothetical protein VFE48_03000 [Methylomirabilota bacterium]|nr:hypothetical protein [Methylomirabilota bacterium]